MNTPLKSQQEFSCLKVEQISRNCIILVFDSDRTHDCWIVSCIARPWGSTISLSTSNNFAGVKISLFISSLPNSLIGTYATSFTSGSCDDFLWCLPIERVKGNSRHWGINYLCTVTSEPTITQSQSNMLLYCSLCRVLNQRVSYAHHSVLLHRQQVIPQHIPPRMTLELERRQQLNQYRINRPANWNSSLT